MDTNILIFFLLDKDEISNEVRYIISDYENILQTSTVCVEEFIHLCQIGKLEEGKRKKGLQAMDILHRIEDAGIQIVPVNKHHLSTYAELSLPNDHHDPNDRLIIAQAIADKTILISSDRKFSQYAQQGLKFLFNKR